MERWLVACGAVVVVVACSEMGTDPATDGLLPSLDPVAKVPVCHFEEETGLFELLMIPGGIPLEKHLAHGDAQPFDEVPGMPGYAFDAACVPVVANSVWTEVPDAGDLPSNSQLPVGLGPLARINGTINDPSIVQGSGNDRDMYLIRITDPEAFVATTEAPVLNLQLFLFDLSGRGVSHNDNDPTAVFSLESRLTGQFVPEPGFYFLAVSRFDRDPTSAGAEVWIDIPLNTERSPDGPGGAGAVDGWNGSQLSFTAAPYSIFLEGAAYAPPTFMPIWEEAGDAGDLPATSQAVAGAGPLLRIDGMIDDPSIPQGPGNDRDMYLIQIDDPSVFEATTVAPALNLQLFLFGLDGRGISHNDNDPNAVFSLESRVTGQFLPGPGQYYLAVSRFDRDPTAAGNEIWLDIPLNTERAADGPGAAGAVDGWNGSSLNFATSDYTILLTGASRVP